MTAAIIRNCTPDANTAIGFIPTRLARAFTPIVHCSMTVARDSIAKLALITGETLIAPAGAVTWVVYYLGVRVRISVVVAISGEARVPTFGGAMGSFPASIAAAGAVIWVGYWAKIGRSSVVVAIGAGARAPTFGGAIVSFPTRIAFTATILLRISVVAAMSSSKFTMFTAETRTAHASAPTLIPRPVSSATDRNGVTVL